jgi:hypothetical protein
MERFPTIHTRLLVHARQDIQRALALEGLEAETRTRGHLALAHILLLQNQRAEASKELNRVMKEAHKYELALLEQKARHLLAR